MRNNCLITFEKKNTEAATGGKEAVVWGVLSKLHGKTPVLESFFNKVASLQHASFFEKRLQLKCFCEVSETFGTLMQISKSPYMCVFI